MTDSLIVETRQGRVEGLAKNGVRQWLGVPYATAERFGLPQTPAPWTGVQPADRFAPQCPQLFGGPARRAKARRPDFDEACLALNIYAPPAGGGLKPVMVWIHGGAFVAGGSNAYNGAEMAALGEAVVVTLNYRLGVLGFVNLGEALDLPEIRSNLGLRDQIAALRWVRENIAAFGGDPGRVTIAGESAGSMSVSLLMLCPEAWPLFHGAIMQSGAVSLLHDREKSLAIARCYVEQLGLRKGDLGALRSLDLMTLFRAQSAAQAFAHLTIPAAPWFDGDLLPDTLQSARAAPHAPVPLLAGSNREEIRLFEMMPGPAILPMKRPDLERLVRDQLSPERAAAVLAAYPADARGRQALATDLTFGMPTRNFAERHAAAQPTWSYRFDYAHPLVGAAHGLDLAFLWPIPGLAGVLVRGGPMRGRRKALAGRMKRHWASFIANGRPDDAWPAFSADRRTTVLFNLDDRVVDDPERTRRRAWAGEDVGPGLTAPLG